MSKPELKATKSAAEDFPKITAHQWWDAIKKELKGNDPASLIHRLEEEIELQPFEMEAPEGFIALPLFPAGYPEPEECFDLTGADPEAIRLWIMESLEAGCRCVSLQGMPEQVNLNILLEGVVPEYIELRLTSQLWDASSDYMAQHPEAVIYRMQKLESSFGDLHKNQRIVVQAEVVSGSAGLVSVLKTADRVAVLLTDRGASAAEAWQRLEIDLKGSRGILENISVMRALHLLWFQLSKLRTGEVMRPVIRYVATDDADTAIPHNRLIDLSMEAVAASLGGAMLFKTEVPALGSSSAGRRLVRNIFHLLKEETALCSQADPVMGSYTIEKLSCDLARVSWQRFNDAD